LICFADTKITMMAIITAKDKNNNVISSILPFQKYLIITRLR